MRTVIYCISKSVRLYGADVNVSLSDDQDSLAGVVLTIYRRKCSIYFPDISTDEQWTAIEAHIGTLHNLNPKLNESARLN